MPAPGAGTAQGPVRALRMNSQSSDRLESSPGRSSRLRWWPAGLVVAALVVFLVHRWWILDVPRQSRVMATAVGVMVGAALLILWWLLASRAPWRWRFLGLGMVVVVLGMAAATFRFVGVTGDLVPIFEPRWKQRGAGMAIASEVVEDAERRSEGRVPWRVPGDFPQFQGVNRDGIVSGIQLEVGTPERLWRQPVGSGWGGFAVVGDRALTQEQDAERETVSCYDLASGRRLWVHAYDARYDNPIGGLGPRATPTVVGDRVYAIGATGMLVCLELATGNRVWGTNVVGTVAAQDLEWGVSSSPLVMGDRVVVAPRGVGGVSLLAVSAATGQEQWRGGTASAHYSSPRLETLLGVPQILTFTAAAAAAHDPESGSVLWEQPWRGGHPHVADPRAVSSNQVLISSGYGTGSRLVEVRRTAEGTGWLAPEEVWRSMRLKSKFANVLLKDGFVYGLDDGKLVCLDLGNGERRWEGERYGHGQVLLVGEVILLTTEAGEVVQVEATPEAFRERHRFAALEGKTWNPPALAGDILVVRNDREATAFRLPVRR